MKKNILPLISTLIAFAVTLPLAFSTNYSVSDGSLFSTGNFLNLPDTLRYELDDCSETAEVCMDILLNDISDYQITTNGQPYANGIAGCKNDTTYFYSYFQLFGQGNLGPYILQSWDINGSSFTTTFNSIPELVDSMNAWDPMGNWTQDAGNLLISGGAEGNTYQDMSIQVVTTGGINILAVNTTFVAQGTAINFGFGVHEVIVTNNNSGVSDSVLVLVACPSTETNDLSLLVGENDVYCFDFTELPGEITSIENICGETVVEFQLVNSNTCVEFTGVGVGEGNGCFVACDEYNFCDTTYLNVQSQIAVGFNEFTTMLLPGESGQWCVDPSIFPGNLDTIFNYCPESSGTYADVALDEDNFCVDYFAIQSAGTDTACIVICDDLANCDTTVFYLTINRDGPAFFYDTLYLNEETTFCDFDLSNLQGTVTTMVNGCPDQSGTEVLYDIDPGAGCVDYTALAEGKDTACIYFTDDQGFMDTTLMIVCVIPPTNDEITETIRLTVNPEYCMDLSQLAGTPQTIENICPDLSGEAVDFVINETTFCVTANPIALGVDTACIVVCDDFDVCDTTTLIITVQDDPIVGPPEAMDDVDTTLQGNAITINACANDFIPVNSTLTNFFYLPVEAGGIGPQNGVAISNIGDCSISYNPSGNFCGVDSFNYVICNAEGCDTALVTVLVDCPVNEFKVFNGFSPNGDDINDFFRIDGLDAYPDHILYVYNRWGMLVLEAIDYQSDWDGTWKGADLPDGTYFYVLDTGEGELRSGYVQISR